MGKGQQTREMILERAASVFNTHGYSASSLSDLMAATGLEKGGIYNHFASKDALALEAFEYAVGRVMARHDTALKGEVGTIEKLRAYCHAFVESAQNPVVSGGCPVLNAAIETTDTDGALRERVQIVMDNWRAKIRVVVLHGISRGELRSSVDGDTLASLMIATLEGAIMLSRLYRDLLHVQRAVEFLSTYLETLRA